MADKHIGYAIDFRGLAGMSWQLAAKSETVKEILEKVPRVNRPAVETLLHNMHDRAFMAAATITMEIFQQLLNEDDD